MAPTSARNWTLVVYVRGRLATLDLRDFASVELAGRPALWPRYDRPAEDTLPGPGEPDPSPLLERVALLPKVSVEREGPINPVRSHELEGGSVYQTQLPGVSKQQVVEGPLVCGFVHPEHV